MEQAVREVTAVLGERRACKQLGIARTTFQRHQVLEMIADETTTSPLDESNVAADESALTSSRQLRRHLARQERKANRASFRALTPEQRQTLLDAVHETRFTDRSVPYIYATLLDENRYSRVVSSRPLFGRLGFPPMMFDPQLGEPIEFV